MPAVACAIVAFGVAACGATPSASVQQEKGHDELRFIAAAPYTPVDPTRIASDITGIPGAGELLEPSQELKSAGYIAVAAFGNNCVILLTASVSEPKRIAAAILTRYDLSRDRLTGSLTKEQLVRFAELNLPDC